MEKLQKIYRLHHLLKSRKHPVSLKVLQSEIESSRATLNRIIRDLRLYYDAPIEYDRERNGYFYANEFFELPGLWFSSEQLLSLLTLQRLLSEAHPGFLDSAISPLRRKIEAILEAEHLGSGELQKRVRIIRMAGRELPPEIFCILSTALVERKRLHICYASRGSGGNSEREVSPQRLTHYRDNWYLDSYCHMREALRSFSVERIMDAKILEGDCKDIPESELYNHFSTSYGIFAGKPEKMAILRFSPKRAKWISEEKWHPLQEGNFLEEGSFELKIPYSDPRELVMDILKYGPDVEVVSPESLRYEVKRQIEETLKNY
ncbi:MAG: WYL domain-containing protein [Pseudomonadota bacterium]|nr:WYL domain-containing protein [Pseudomonadota bacterium]